MTVICNQQALENAKNDEIRELNAYRSAVNGGQNDETINEYKQKALEKMMARENLVKRCIDNIEIATELDTTTQASQATVSSVSDLTATQSERTTKAFNDMVASRNNKQRMIEINTYYSKQYQAYIDILKMIFYFCIPLFILGMLQREEIIDDVVYFRLSLLIVVIGFFAIAGMVNDLYWRNNLVFDNYEWLYAGNTNKGIIEQNKKTYNLNRGLNVVGEDLSTGTQIGCVGEACCGTDTTWNSIQKKCEKIA
jgi:hypothetical protein